MDMWSFGVLLWEILDDSTLLLLTTEFDTEGVSKADDAIVYGRIRRYMETGDDAIFMPVRVLILLQCC